MKGAACFRFHQHNRPQELEHVFRISCQDHIGIVMRVNTQAELVEVHWLTGCSVGMTTTVGYRSIGNFQRLYYEAEQEVAKLHARKKVLDVAMKQMERDRAQ